MKKVLCGMIIAGMVIGYAGGIMRGWSGIGRYTIVLTVEHELVGEVDVIERSELFSWE